MHMEMKVGDVYVRHSDERVWIVKKIEGNKILLESPDKMLTMTDIYGLAKSYSKVENNNR